MRSTLCTAIVLAALLPLGGGCSSSSAAGQDGGAHEAGTAGDGGAGDGSATSGWAFVPDQDPLGDSAVWLEPSATDPGWLELRVQGVATLQGIAFRLTFDAAAVRVLDTEAGDIWAQSASKHVARFAVRPDGQLWAGIGHVGVDHIVAHEPVTVARIKLHLDGGSAAALRFAPGRNMVLAPDGRTVAVSWRGGQLQPAAGRR